jgi:large subunit ribosomal protein L15
MQRRLPKRGFKSPSRTAYHPVNLAEIDGLSSEWSQVGVAELRSGGLVPRMCEAVKLLGGGELSRAVNLVVHAASASAVKKVEQVGGRVTILPSNGRPLRTVR